MWAKKVWVHPSQRRFRTELDLSDGSVLTQEVTGKQLRAVAGLGCTPGEYSGIVREAEGTEFLDELNISASEQIHFGIPLFSVEGSGSRKVPAGVVHDGSYVYTPGQ